MPTSLFPSGKRAKRAKRVRESTFLRLFPHRIIIIMSSLEKIQRETCKNMDCLGSIGSQFFLSFIPNIWVEVAAMGINYVVWFVWFIFHLRLRRPNSDNWNQRYFDLMEIDILDISSTSNAPSTMSPSYMCHSHNESVGLSWLGTNQ